MGQVSWVLYTQDWTVPPLYTDIHCVYSHHMRRFGRKWSINLPPTSSRGLFGQPPTNKKKKLFYSHQKLLLGGGGSFDFLFSQDGYIVRSVYVNTLHSCCHRLLYSKSSNFFSHHPLRCGQKKEKSPASCLNVQQCAFPVAPDSWPLLSLCLFFFFILIYPICCIVIILFLVQSGEQNCSAAENPDLLLLRPVYSLLLLLPLPLVHLLIDHGKTLKLQITHNIMKGKLKMCFYSSSFRSSSLRICVRIYRRRETKSKFSGRTSTIKRKKLKKKNSKIGIPFSRKKKRKKKMFIYLIFLKLTPLEYTEIRDAEFIIVS